MRLAEAGAEVVVYERLRYPGGCASTFERGGHRYESGATLFSGFGEGQLFRRWIDRDGLSVQVDAIDPLVTLHTPEFSLPICRDRASFVDRITALAPESAHQVRAFFQYQGQVAETLWSLFDAPETLPSFGVSGLRHHLRSLPAYVPLLRHLGRPLTDVMARFGVMDVQPLRVFLDAVCQITVQAASHEAEAAFALGAMDYFFRGTGHVRGGIGELGHALCSSVERRGGEVRFSNEVRSLERRLHRWRVHARRGSDEFDAVLANLLPSALMRMLPADVNAPESLVELDREVREGWGAAMLYLRLDPAFLERGELASGHHELVADIHAPFHEGNHVFCSIGDVHERDVHEGAHAPTVTVSTHVPLSDTRDDASYFRGVHERMQQTIRERLPALSAATVGSMSASPRTFERFTGRPGGIVGGIPRRAGWQNYRRMWPQAISRGLYLVGDSVFPGQSTLATALGGIKTAERCLSDLG